MSYLTPWTIEILETSTSVQYSGSLVRIGKLLWIRGDYEFCGNVVDMTGIIIDVHF